MTSADSLEPKVPVQTEEPASPRPRAVPPAVPVAEAPATPPAAPAESAPIHGDIPARVNPQMRSRAVNLTIVALVLGAVAAILYAWQLPPFGGRYEQTDNAYVRGQTTIISPQVSGYVADVPVQDFQNVQAGQVLVRIEDQIYRAKVAQARANVLTQVANLDNSAQAQKSREANELSEDA